MRTSHLQTVPDPEGAALQRWRLETSDDRSERTWHRWVLDWRLHVCEHGCGQWRPFTCTPWRRWRWVADTDRAVERLLMALGWRPRP